ncbi:killer cell lectin-like receptor subfamily F member 1 [Columba livia]|uniref:Killer cell lectin-like receptor subfamily F member 1 n=1 Tax=Columba livia TaxID=8932 RepID=A0A2I0LY13_COLLI|nr:killer cell lectin-like receptor subfamily F member 1 [Columba livia]
MKWDQMDLVKVTAEFVTTSSQLFPALPNIYTCWSDSCRRPTILRLFLNVVFLGAVITLIQQCDLLSNVMQKPRENLSESGSIFEEDLNDNNLLTTLKESLFMHANDSRCELCPTGWKLHYGRCYYYSETCDTWQNSRKYC